jgi:hypothetical protein
MCSAELFLQSLTRVLTHALLPHCNTAQVAIVLAGTASVNGNVITVGEANRPLETCFCAGRMDGPPHAEAVTLVPSATAAVRVLVVNEKLLKIRADDLYREMQQLREWAVRSALGDAALPAAVSHVAPQLRSEWLGHEHVLHIPAGGFFTVLQGVVAVRAQLADGSWWESSCSHDQDPAWVSTPTHCIVYALLYCSICAMYCVGSSASASKLQRASVCSTSSSSSAEQSITMLLQCSAMHTYLQLQYCTSLYRLTLTHSHVQSALLLSQQSERPTGKIRAVNVVALGCACLLVGTAKQHRAMLSSSSPLLPQPRSGIPAKLTVSAAISHCC